MSAFYENGRSAVLYDSDTAGFRVGWFKYDDRSLGCRDFFTLSDSALYVTVVVTYIVICLVGMIHAIPRLRGFF